MSLEKRLKLSIRKNEQLVQDLKLVRDMKLPECYIAAGYIRNYIWDELHGFDHRERHNDIDVIYYDPKNRSEERDRKFENKLINITQNEKWSVKNQARMHIKNGNNPYKSTIDAIAHWPETVTAIGVRINNNNELQVVSPYGLEELFQMVVRRTPLFSNKQYYLERVKSKNWTNQWPLLKVIEE